LSAEQFRELRTNINYITATSKDKCKVILTTSSIPKEGKSFVAINAAISLSLTGARVVLLEFDMRKPKISKPLGINADPGLSNYLVGNATVEEVIKPHATIKNLFVIPSGPIPPNPAELMTNEKLQILFTYLKQHFDYVLIDSPPIAAVTDAKILSPFADAVIYIVRHNYTNYVFLNLLYDVYQKKSLTNINIVFNGIKNKKILGYGYSGYGYGYGYGYNYGYGYTVEDQKKNSLLSSLFKRFKNKIK
jgi:capsular exopolysaccharide synthesis family protein